MDSKISAGEKSTFFNAICALDRVADLLYELDANGLLDGPQFSTVQRSLDSLYNQLERAMEERGISV